MPTGLQCIYCGGSTRGVRRGEHILQDAIGGARTIKCVCKKCNGNFSDIDQGLISQSPLALATQQVLGVHAVPVWDYHPGLDLALEAWLAPELRYPVLWPQLVFLGEKVFFTFDQEEAERMGIPEYVKAFRYCLNRALNSMLAKPKRPLVRWERVHRPPVRGRYPPRIYTPHTFDEWCPKMSFCCRFTGSMERGRVLYLARNWQPVLNRRTLSSGFGVIDPESGHRFQPEFVLRALVKIALNLLADMEGPLFVSPKSFPMAIAYVRRGNNLSLRYETNGFLEEPSGIFGPSSRERHLLELTHSDGVWRLIAAFFGGLIAACVHFPGPSPRSWSRLTVEAPLKSKQWRVEKSLIVIPRKLCINWDNLARMMPTLPIRYGGSSINRCKDNVSVLHMPSSGS